MNNTRGSTPRNPNLDLPNHSMDLSKTLGMLGTPHEESIIRHFEGDRVLPSSPTTIRNMSGSMIDDSF
jgi:hypothetical protein